MDIKPPKNYRRQPTQHVIPPVSAQRDVVLPVAEQDVSLPDMLPEIAIETPLPQPRKSSRKKKLLFVVLSILGLALVAVTGALFWYFQALEPRDATASMQSIVIEEGMAPEGIGRMLEEKQIIRSGLAFEVYVSLNSVANKLQAGSYRIGPAQSVSTIVEHLVKGKNDTFNVIILPGLTLRQLADPSIKKSLAAQGFSSKEISEAFSASYSSPVLASRPSGATLEGYLFPETYQLRAGDTLESLIQRSLDELYGRLQTEGLIEKFAARGLTIHEAITLASIVQKEVSAAADQPQVAQVFLKRLSEGMMLGSDVTFIYAAEQAGVTPTVDYESIYNTRKYTGLPPGPIANMNMSALEAVANPAEGDYLFFVAGDGDDTGKTFFSRTYEEHTAAVTAHCHVLCQ